ncbi:flagellar biosynthetic protein FliO [soil metagenome]
MDLLALVRAAFGLILTLGLVGLCAYAARRWGPTGMFQMKPAADRRMAIVETLSLGPTTRLLIVKVDAEERIVIVGEGRVLPGPSSSLGAGRGHA